MKIKEINIKNCWVYLFLLFFILVPLNYADYISYTVLFFALFAFVLYKFDIPKFPLILFIIALFLRIGVVLRIKTPPQSDFLVLYEASQGVLEGDFSFLDRNYFQKWAYQTGFVLYQSILLRICNKMLFLKLVNCILSTLTVVLVYLIAKEFAGKKAAAFVSIIYCFLPFPFTLVTVLTNQIPATFLIYLGIYIVISSKINLKSYIRYLIFALLTAFSNVLRPEGIIPIVAVVLFLILTFNKKSIKETFINLLIVVLVYFLMFELISILFKATGISPLGLTNNASYWKFVLGFNHETSGSYSSADMYVIGDKEAAYELIKERIFVPIGQLKDLFVNKINKFWNSCALHWSFGYAKSGLYLFGKEFQINDFVRFLEKVNVFAMNIIYVTSIYGVFANIRKKVCDYRFLYLANMVFVTFGVYLLIEVQPRYAYNIQPAVFILAALGISTAAKWIKGKKANQNI